MLTTRILTNRCLQQKIRSSTLKSRRMVSEWIHKAIELNTMLEYGGIEVGKEALRLWKTNEHNHMAAIDEFLSLQPKTDEEKLRKWALALVGRTGRTYSSSLNTSYLLAIGEKIASTLAEHENKNEPQINQNIIAAALSDLALYQAYAGRFFLSTKSHQKALDVMKSIPIQDQDPFLYANIHLQYGKVLSKFFGFDKKLESEARLHLEIALAKFKKLQWGANDGVSIACRISETEANLGLVLLCHGLHSQAEQMIEAAIIAQRERGNALGEADSLNIYGLLLTKIGRKLEAKGIFSKACEIRKSVYGESSDHTEIAEAISNLAFLENDFEKALSLYEEAASILRRKHGENSILIAPTLDSQAVVLFNLGRLRQSETLLRNSLRIRRQVLGNQHIDVGESLHNLASVLWSIRLQEKERLEYNQEAIDDKEVVALFLEAIAIRKNKSDQQKEQLAQSLLSLGEVLRIVPNEIVSQVVSSANRENEEAAIAAQAAAKAAKATEEGKHTDSTQSKSMPTSISMSENQSAFSSSSKWPRLQLSHHTSESALSEGLGILEEKLGKDNDYIRSIREMLSASPPSSTFP